jgi:hypothetical protein
MRQIGIWRVTDEGLNRLSPSNVGLEKNLEDWIEEDPSLLEEGLEIVGRQVHVDGGLLLDLLGLDAQGQWMVIELKSGAVRGQALTQVLYYASCVAKMPWNDLQEKVQVYLRKRGKSLADLVDEPGQADEDSPAVRDVVMYVVGTGSYASLDRMINFLAGVHSVPMKLVSYEVFEIGDRHKILVRELTEPEISTPDKRPTGTVEELCTSAEKHGIGDEFRLILEAARRHGLYPRPYRASIMYTPPSNDARMLFTVRDWTQSDGLMRVYFGVSAFAEFYAVDKETVRSIFGRGGGTSRVKT